MKKLTIKIINSAIPALCVLLGAFTEGFPTLESIFTAFVASLVIGLTQFKEELEDFTTNKKGKVKVFNFINL